MFGRPASSRWPGHGWAWRNGGDGGPGRGGKVRFRILGPLEVWTGQDWSGIGAPKWRALLAALLLSQGQVVSTDRLIAELWGDDPPDRAANLVSVYVLRLRRVLGDPEGRVLTTRAPGYQLLLQPGDLDAEQFRDAGRPGPEGPGRGRLPRRAADVLAEALGLWRGRALADVPPSALVTAEADRLEESRLTALELRIEADLGCGLHAQLVPELRRLLSDQPLREGLWGLLIRALDGAGRHAEALAAYGQAREVIADELGVDPGPELQRLYQAMLTADAAPVAAAAWQRRPRCGAVSVPPARQSPDAAARRAGPRSSSQRGARPASRRRGRLHRPGGAPGAAARRDVGGRAAGQPGGGRRRGGGRSRPGQDRARDPRRARAAAGFPATASSTSACAAGASSRCHRTRSWPGSCGTSGWTAPGCRWTPKSAPPCTAPGWPSGRC